MLTLSAMGKGWSRRKRERFQERERERLKRAMQEVLPKPEPDEVDPRPTKTTYTTATTWLRSTGIPSTLLGGIGIFQGFFWSGVIVFYLGVLLVAIDLCFERWHPRWKKWAFAVAIGILALGTGKYLVFQKDGIFVCQFPGIGNETALRVSIVNTSQEDDYHNKDVTIRTLPPLESTILGVRETSNLNGVILAEPPQGSLRKDDFLVFGYNDGRNRGNHKRVLCDKLPRDGILNLEFVFDKLPKNLSIEGKYDGKFRTRYISRIIPAAEVRGK